MSDWQARLPKAALLTIQWRWDWRFCYFARFRLANSIRWQLGPITLTHRAPWLEGVARSIHPHLFTGSK